MAATVAGQILRGAGVSAMSAMVVVLCAAPAWSEWYADLYGGAVFDGRVELTQASSATAGETTSEVKLEPGFTAGVRGGYWLESLPFGVGVDLFYLKADTSSQSVAGVRDGTPVTVNSAASQTTATAIALDLLRVRFPFLHSQRFPHGRIQPFLTAGPTLFFTKFKDSGGAVFPANQSQSKTVWGVKIGAGVTVQMSRLVGLFAEYRFTHFQADVALRNATVPSTETLERIIDAHHIVGGLSFAF